MAKGKAQERRYILFRTYFLALAAFICLACDFALRWESAAGAGGGRGLRMMVVRRGVRRGTFTTFDVLCKQSRR